MLADRSRNRLAQLVIFGLPVFLQIKHNVPKFEGNDHAVAERVAVIVAEDDRAERGNKYVLQPFVIGTFRRSRQPKRCDRVGSAMRRGNAPMPLCGTRPRSGSICAAHLCRELRRRVQYSDVDRTQAETQTASNDVDLIKIEVKVVRRLLPPLLEECSGWHDDQRRYRPDTINAGKGEDGLSTAGNNADYAAIIRAAPIRRAPRPASHAELA